MDIGSTTTMSIEPRSISKRVLRAKRTEEDFENKKKKFFVGLYFYANHTGARYWMYV